MANTNRYHDRNTWAAMSTPDQHRARRHSTKDTYRPYTTLVDEDTLDEWLASRPAAPHVSAPVRPAFEPSGFPTPILALDVDGPCSPFAMARKAASRAGFRDVAWRSRVTYRKGSTWCPYSTLLLSRSMGDMLAAFSRDHDVELVWASLWEHNANTIIAPALGLPRLRYADFNSHPTKGLWKFPAMAEFGAGRPMAWLDDSFTSPRKVAARTASGFDLARRGLPTLLHRVSPSVGIARADLDVVAEWLKTARLAWSAG